MQKKLIVSDFKNKLILALLSDGHFDGLEVFDPDEKLPVGTILIAKVQTVVKNIDSAFLDLGDGQVGYYSMASNKRHLIMSGASFVWTDRKLKSGDEILVMIEKAAVKTKDPVCTSNLTITGSYSVITAAKSEISISAKIKDERFRKEIKAEISKCNCVTEVKFHNYGVIVRTDAYDCPREVLLEEIQRNCDLMDSLIRMAATRVAYTVIKRPESAWKTAIREYGLTDGDEIVTDLKGVYEEIGAFLKETDTNSGAGLRLYEDALLPLNKLYSLEKFIEDSTDKKVWLNSGGNIVIEHTEAMTVIDVNTGKNIDNKNREENFLRINKEAAVEIAKQLRIRNISGIIIIDFIDLKSKEMQSELQEFFRDLLKKDKVKTSLVDFTALGLAEVTRMKVKKPLYEVLK